jgi:hypothetical protein
MRYQRMYFFSKPVDFERGAFLSAPSKHKTCESQNVLAAGARHGKSRRGCNWATRSLRVGVRAVPFRNLPEGLCVESARPGTEKRTLTESTVVRCRIGVFEKHFHRKLSRAPWSESFNKRHIHFCNIRRRPHG